MKVLASTTVGSLVADRLGRASLFDRLGIDYCCHGNTPLNEACAARALDVDRVISEIADCDRQLDGAGPDETDCRSMSATDLAAHIVEVHHRYLRRELPRLSVLLEKVSAAHGARHPELEDLRRTFAGLREELEFHLMKEEQVLFPLVARLEAAQAAFPIHCGTVENPIRVMMHEHDDAGRALERMRSLTSGYTTPEDGCASYRALFDGLLALEADLHRHIHKENNILFPRAAAAEAALASCDD
jgi:regulator of cell morphogenesis and NO signaling